MTELERKVLAGLYALSDNSGACNLIKVGLVFSDSELDAAIPYLIARGFIRTNSTNYILTPAALALFDTLGNLTFHNCKR